MLSTQHAIIGEHRLVVLGSAIVLAVWVGTCFPNVGTEHAKLGATVTLACPCHFVLLHLLEAWPK